MNFDWGVEAPVDGVKEDRFSVSWEGKVTARYSEPTALSLAYDNTKSGVRLWIDGGLLIDRCKADKDDQGQAEVSETVALVAGQRHSIRVEYYDKKNEANVRLSWASTSQPKEVVPVTVLYPAIPVSGSTDSETSRWWR